MSTTLASTSTRAAVARACASASSSASPSSSASSSSASSSRMLSTTAPLRAKPRRARQMNDPFALRNMGKFNYDDIPTLGHLVLDRQRELLGYARVAHHEMPKLLELRRPYEPKRELLRFRLVHLQGEAHPMTAKAVMTVSVADLFEHLAGQGKLRDADARRKFLLLAGPRWDAGHVKHGVEEAEKEALQKGVGEIKISSERFQVQAQNVKWCSDALDRMIEEASSNSAEFKDVAIDFRPTLVREAKRKGFERRAAPSIKDFPQEWL
ncbi:hypothetical protein FA10DRAFT_270177 [Acaromyces ingoldii]|uniref:Small ribosomal subunit protein mS35 mitochondrial conserved domain-containing protein n=1 Tax=Acaromyces ingoldii TaxID=215250 RepID=A0A316YCM2_9BASI|nr:hypothetical protein FA10DRAFT_270177 [Acaromyces ingoldii]PWN86624.1 hypothetical protein FA10DRAFT_270177 [Acaromyces ingoldii]